MTTDGKAGSRVLVVEDEPLIAMMVQDWLDELDCQTIGPASSVDGALKLIGDGSIDGAILDVSLGRGDSFPVAEELARRGVPFAFATGYGSGGPEPRFPQAIVLAKPFVYANFRTAVLRLLNRDAGVGDPA